ncbi:peptidase M28 [Gluconacetobacter sacchari DSM 12717]|uniref:DUF4910 domain-containing protein n=2 Tax=Gluconacetobacter sacchari TaxID=92759 RepID=A0A7W4NQE1_9PROT|nr:DUF4910 domain-containing protein [Gluconacetobacter sacchari]MBB2162449.1 DUF4910 domain-containing protein [Gluconacetobacter sacchari]GBQ24700.1 peptidase M28 [Gluconacetobacter sacchari DSM 12717]
MKIESRMIEIVNGISNSDRTQASNATRMTCQNLMDYVKSFLPSASCHIHDFAASPEARPLGFAAPASWELITGTVSFSRPDATPVRLDHAAHPMLVATNSCASTGVLPVCAPTDTSPAGKLVLLSGPKEQFPAQLAAAARGNAAGVASAAFSKRICQKEARGRIELSSYSDLFALSLTPSEHHYLAAALEAGPVAAEVAIAIDQLGCVPVLEIRTDPAACKEILLCAHICHLRPGANDNASGVALLCELLRTAAESLPAVRLVFAPEFTGMSAYLAATAVKPVFVVNVDMVGGDPAITGAQLELECSPPYLHHPLQDRLAELFSSSPELGCRVTAFKGYSDHALFASKAVAVPAVLIGQTGDVYNHTDLDRVENLCPDQMASLCKLLTRFLVEAAPYYDVPGFPVTSAQSKDAWPFNIYALFDACDEAMAQDIRTRLTDNKETYARLQRAYLAAQWHQESLGDSWAENVIANFRQAGRHSHGRHHAGQR